MATAASEYEIMLLTLADLDEPARAAIVDRVKTSVAKGGGSFVKLDEWGRRKLAYAIAKQEDAHYSLVHVDCDGDTLKEAIDLLRITDGVLRVMAVNRVPVLPEGVELAGISDEEAAAPRRERGRGGRGGGRGRDRDRD